MVLKDPNVEELKTNYVVREFHNVELCEKESTLRTDKETGFVYFSFRISSHIRRILESPNEDIEITRAVVDENEINQIGGKIPINSMLIQIKKEPRNSKSVARLVTS